MLALILAAAVTIGTVPKSGSHLLEKAVRAVKADPDHHYFRHLDWFSNTVNYYPLEGYIINIRDPRDCFISLLDWVENTRRDNFEETGLYFDSEINGQDYFTRCSVVWLKPKWDTLTYDEKLLALLNLDEDVCPSPENIYERNFKKASDLMHHHNVTVIRFENLVGSKGGGSDELQFKEVKKIARAMRQKLSKAEVQAIASDLFGDTKGTFHKGKIGRWKSVYKPEHVAAFKKHWNKYLVQWGYEKSDAWDLPN